MQDGGFALHETFESGLFRRLGLEHANPFHLDWQTVEPEEKRNALLNPVWDLDFFAVAGCILLN